MVVTFKYRGEPITEDEFYAALLRVGGYLTTTQGDDVTMEIVDIHDIRSIDIAGMVKEQM